MRIVVAGGVLAACAILLVSAECRAGSKSPWLQQRENRFAEWKTQTAGHIMPRELWDAPAAPELVVIPPGEFVMGAPRSEPDSFEAERPQHQVRVGYPLAAGRFDVTRGEFAEFVAETHYDATPGGCLGFNGKTFEQNARYTWRNPGFPQTDEHPVVCVSWDDANAYARWLSAKTGKPYRLLSEAEWEYAARAGHSSEFWWGTNVEAGCNFSNMADVSAKAVFPYWGVVGCNDRHVFTSPVGAFPANPNGLYDISGNVWQWVADCWTRDYSHAPMNGSAQQHGNCTVHVIRGGSWNDRPRGERLAYRAKARTGVRGAGLGFRVARPLDSSDLPAPSGMAHGMAQMAR